MTEMPESCVGCESYWEERDLFDQNAPDEVRPLKGVCAAEYVWRRIWTGGNRPGVVVPPAWCPLRKGGE